MRTVFAYLFILFSVSISGQDTTKGSRVRTCVGSINTDQPEFIVIIDTLRIKFDSISVDKINPKWIKKMEVLKEVKDMDTFGNKTACILIYPKKRYYKRIIKISLMMG